MKKITSFILILLLLSCASKENETPRVEFSEVEKTSSGLTEAELYDRILGMMVGAAIGDAMGAPTEMWNRASIQLEYGFVDGLDSMIRESSPEGIWKPNLPAGGTTDDTRWKNLGVEYLLTQSEESLDAKEFAAHVLKK